MNLQLPDSLVPAFKLALCIENVSLQISEWL